MLFSLFSSALSYNFFYIFFSNQHLLQKYLSLILLVSLSFLWNLSLIIFFMRLPSLT